jgi:sulfoxide reductase heme-binding subunit YedZ
MAEGRSFPILLAGFAALFGLGLGLAWGGDPLAQWTLAARYTARAGFPIFLLTYSASALVRLWPVPLWKSVLRRRRQWGLGFALAHAIHLGALATAFATAGEWPGATTLAGGGGAYVLLFAMALTSNDASQRALGVWWKRLHTLGIHWLWFIFTFSYFGRLFEPERWMQGAVFFPLCIAALAVRVAAAFSARRRRVAA